MDIVTLRIPRERRPLPLIHVILGGVALRHHLPLDYLEDMELAIDNLLAGESPGAGVVAMTISVAGSVLGIRLDGLENQDLRTNLRSVGSFHPRERCPIDMRVLLRCLVDSYHVDDAGGGGFSVRVEKQVKGR